MKVLIGADIVPTLSNEDDFINGNEDELIDGKMKEILSEQDFIVMNLETPLYDGSNPILKCGPNLIANTKCINGLKKINPYFYTLANNHIMDHGRQGLISTMHVLDKNKIKYAGAGKNLDEASKPYIFVKDGFKIGLICCADTEFSIATKDDFGANPFDSIETYDQIISLKKKCDYLIVLYHGGKEYYRYPSPYIQKICRKMVDTGADLVVCQHSHCVGCDEKWNSGKIIYGQGNFLFDGGYDEFWSTGIVICLELDSNNVDIQYYPIEKQKGKIYISDKNNILDEMSLRSERIVDEKFILTQYKKFSEKILPSFLYAALGRKSKGILFRLFNKISHGKYILAQYSLENLLRLKNSIITDAHRELVLNGIDELIAKKAEIERRKSEFSGDLGKETEK